jgi:hypothetical protein
VNKHDPTGHLCPGLKAAWPLALLYIGLQKYIYIFYLYFYSFTFRGPVRFVRFVRFTGFSPENGNLKTITPNQTQGATNYAKK